MPSESKLILDAETQRRLGYLVIDQLVEWSSRLDSGPAAVRATRRELEAELAPTLPPEDPSDFAALVDRLMTEVIPYGQRTDHPRFMGYVPGAATWPAVLGDLIVGGCDVFGGSWLGNSGTAVLELTVLDWIKSWLGYPSVAEGLLTSGGSEANLLAVLCARKAILDDELEGAVVYVTGQVHASVDRALRATGIADRQIRGLVPDGQYRMQPERLHEAIREDVADGRRPFSWSRTPARPTRAQSTHSATSPISVPRTGCGCT